MRSARILAFAALVASFLLFLRTDDARACGGFASARRASEGELAKSLPFLTVEQVLIVWDKETGTEDFIREARFERANEAFGFVVPVPSKPEVSGVGTAPFDKLREAYSFVEPSSSRGGGLGGLGVGAGGSGAASAPPVVVLSKQRIGSFTAFTLATTDAGAFDKWLADNGFAMTAESKSWLEHYVALKFFFTAFRYEPKAKNDAPVQHTETAMTSQTVRIRFKTPLPYYPYLEPAHGSSDERPSERMLTGWAVTREPMAPVAARRNALPRFSRPWTLGIPSDATTAELRKAVGPDLAKVIPNAAKPFVVQPFRDLKVSREGFGDVVLVPSNEGEAGADAGKAASPSEEDLAARRSLLPVIDPELLDGPPSTKWGSAVRPKPPELRAAPLPAPAPSAAATSSAAGPIASATSSRRTVSCATAPGGGAATSWPLGILALGAAVLAVRRRRSGVPPALAALAMVLVASGCRRHPPVAAADSGPDAGAPVLASASASAPGDDGSPSPAPAPTLSREEREKAALAILSGDVPPGGIAPDEQPPPRRAGGTGLGSLVSSPSGTVQIAAVTFEKGAIANAERVVTGLRPRFRACYNAALQTDPGLEGTLVLRAVISGAGEVTSAAPVENRGVSPAMATCLATVMKRATLDPQDAGTASLRVELTFERL